MGFRDLNGRVETKKERLHFLAIALFFISRSIMIFSCGNRELKMLHVFAIGLRRFQNKLSMKVRKIKVWVAPWYFA